MSDFAKTLATLFCLSTALLISGCQDAESKMCNDATAKPKMAVGACGESCDRGKTEDCARQIKLGNDHCIAKKNKEVCEWMCEYGHKGKELYCAAHKKLGGDK